MPWPLLLSRGWERAPVGDMLLCIRESTIDVVFSHSFRRRLLCNLRYTSCLHCWQTSKRKVCFAGGRSEMLKTLTATRSFVFGGFINTTGWNDGAAWLLGFLQGAFTLVAYDA